MLTALGLNSLFDGSSDLSGLTGNKNLKLSKAIHKAFVEIKEEGAEAAAVTGFEIETISVIVAPLQSVKVDRPFLFLIQDNASGLILFFGEVNQILSK